MHQDAWESPDGSNPADRAPGSESSDSNPPGNGKLDGEVSRFPLLNWQVVEPVMESVMEIDGEATLIEETEIEDAAAARIRVSPPALLHQPPPSSGDARASATIRDHYDDVVVAGMQLRRVAVMPGETAEFEVSVANHGRWGALFEITIEGWIDEAWTPDLPLRVQLEPHARQVVKVPISPPRQPNCQAGEHALAIVVRAGRYPGHLTRLAATLVVERYASLKLGSLLPYELDLSWFVPSATTRLPITNQSNYAATVHLQGVDRARQCDFTFYTEDYTEGYTEGDTGVGAIDDGIMGTARLTLQPGQTVTVPVEVRTRQRPFFGLVPRETPFRLVARMDTEPPLRRAADGQLAMAALIGPWHMAVAGVLAVIAIFGTGLAGLALLVALRAANPAQSAPPVAAATAVPAAPVVAFVIQMDQPMPTRAPDDPIARDNMPAQGIPQGELPEVALDAPQTGNAAPSIPVVRADQVTAPGEPTPVGQQPLRPIVVTTPVAQGQMPQAQSVQGRVEDSAPAQGIPAQANPAQANNASLTYGQMFKQVASHFDLDWRVLAAQAYLESGFDSLALSGQGDMGLMQIRPGTWNEWAPTVDASDPFDSYSNVLVGAAYLNYLRAELSAMGFSQPEWMLVAYNWGPEKVFSHIGAGGTWESLDPERRRYAEDILRIAASIPPS